MSHLPEHLLSVARCRCVFALHMTGVAAPTCNGLEMIRRTCALRGPACCMMMPLAQACMVLAACSVGCRAAAATACNADKSVTARKSVSAWQRSSAALYAGCASPGPACDAEYHMQSGLKQETISGGNCNDRSSCDRCSTALMGSRLMISTPEMQKAQRGMQHLATVPPRAHAAPAHPVPRLQPPGQRRWLPAPSLQRAQAQAASLGSAQLRAGPACSQQPPAALLQPAWGGLLTSPSTTPLQGPAAGPRRLWPRALMLLSLPTAVSGAQPAAAACVQPAALGATAAPGGPAAALLH